MQVILTQEEYDAVREDATKAKERAKKSAMEAMGVFMVALRENLRIHRGGDFIAPSSDYVTVEGVQRAITKAQEAIDLWSKKL